MYLVRIHKVEEIEEAELDEMWGYVGSKENPRGLWHAIDHHSGKVLVDVFGNHEDAVFFELKKLLDPFGYHHVLYRWLGGLRTTFTGDPARGRQS
jgi:hypothetical protein